MFPFQSISCWEKTNKQGMKAKNLLVQKWTNEARFGGRRGLRSKGGKTSTLSTVKASRSASERTTIIMAERASDVFVGHDISCQQRSSLFLRRLT
jgi:hypothetical protein